MPKLFEVKTDNVGLTIRNKSQTDAEIVLYGDIGANAWGDSIDAKDFKKMLDAMPTTVKNISLRVNSRGGDVFDGFAIYNLLRQHKAKITAYIDGVALSIASIIIQAADSIVMGEGSYIMIHKPWTFAMGNSEELEGVIDRLSDIEEQLVSVYAKKMKKSRQEIKTAMKEETWYDADEAISVGLATSRAEENYKIAASYNSALPWGNKLVHNPKVVKNKIKDFLKNY